MRFASWRWTPVWAVPLVGVWLGWLLLTPLLLDHPTPLRHSLDSALLIGALATLPFFVFALASLVARPQPHVLRAVVIGGLATAALVWATYNGVLGALALGAIREPEDLTAGWLAAYLAAGSPLIVAGGMLIGRFVARRSNPAG